MSITTRRRVRRPPLCVAYATSVVVRPDRRSSWDRGWNEAGEQVWGAVQAGYEFVRRGEGPPPPEPGGAGNADSQE